MIQCGFLVFLLLSSVANATDKEISVQGTVIIAEGKARLIRTKEKDTLLTSSDPLIAGIFQDSRISGKNMKLEGKFLPDGSFEIKRFHIAHGESLYRLIYFCEVCNIHSFGPGDCVCCQAPFEPLEVLPSDPRVRQ
jgi:hypothetical protein